MPKDLKKYCCIFTCKDENRANNQATAMATVSFLVKSSMKPKSQVKPIVKVAVVAMRRSSLCFNFEPSASGF